jgi:hypothetical protein
MRQGDPMPTPSPTMTRGITGGAAALPTPDKPVHGGRAHVAVGLDELG